MRSGRNCGIMPAVRGNLKQYAIGAAGGGAATMLIIAIYIVATANARGADGGDWLNFAAVIFGVGATIGGTLAIERLMDARNHSNAVAGLLEALTMWTATVGQITADLTPARIGDLRQQNAYIITLSAELGRSARTQRMIAHAFTFHVPAMIGALEKAMTEMVGAQQAVIVGHVANEMTRYAHLLRGVLRAG